MATFVPPINPSVGLSRQVTPRVLGAAFGDGYTQRGGDGLNAIPRKLSLTWAMLAFADAGDIESFFVNQKGYLHFDWMDPNELVSRNWVCSTWTRTSIDGLNESITATFDQVFDV